MTELFWYVRMTAAGMLALFLLGICFYMAGRLVSAGWHVSKLKLIRKITMTKETDRG